MFEYLSLNTKISALKNQLLNREDYLKLTGIKNNSEYLSLLKTYPAYQTILSQTPNDCKRTVFEKTVSNKLFENYFKLFPHSGIYTKYFLKHYFKKYEIDNIKSILKNKIYVREENNANVNIYNLGDYSELDFKRLMTANSVDDFISMLNNTDYHQVLSDANLVFSREKTFFAFDLALDNYFFTQLKRVKNTLPSNDRQRVDKLLGIYVDLINITWIVRAKFNYNLANEQILAQIIDFSSNISKTTLNDILLSPDIGTVESVLNKSFYQKLFGTEKKLNLEISDIQINRFLRERIGIYLSGAMFDIGKILAYLIIEELEIKDLVTIYESHYYQLSENEIKEQLSIITN